ncbi:arylsulfatase [Chitinophaga sancti]|uniref:arylsulfatase n=1 Tax=Chitinophaga sancti TaxID=1004 RepID=UPI002A75754D|nr:arylsulfatase [Chitinophaga sancti]WPQ65810.1 arylsulfatase [Chitinophaga sancti]
MHRKKLIFSAVTVCAGVVLLFSLGGFKKADPPKKKIRPNIVVILADDMGFSDVGCYGGEINTPNINYLAENGIRYTQFYNTSRCCPTRASLLTGLYNHQAGIGKMTDAEDEPGYLGHITENAVTLAEVLKAAGYHTAMSGKWHVSNTDGQPDPKEQLNWLNHHTTYPAFSPIAQYPTSRGFEKFFGTIWGVVDFYDPFSLVSGTTPIKEVPKDYYHTDAIADTAVAYIKGYADDDKPFFLYVAENAPHWPLHALPEDIAKYKDTYKGGWEAVREARYKKMVKLGLIDSATTKLSPRFKDEQSWASNPDKEWDAAAMATHAAMIDRMDQGIGRIIKALKETNQLDNTLIVFLSDNGASAEICNHYGPGFDRPNETRDGRKIEYADKKAMPGPETTYYSIGPRWANVANTPYRYWKAESFEGGIHTPMIAFWPKGITAKKGGFSKQVGHVMDFMNTFIEMAGAKYPANYNGHAIQAGNGVSLVPSFKGQLVTGHEELFNEHFGARYARVGNWKLVSASNDSTWHLFNLEKDRSETNDLAAQEPLRVKELEGLWREWANTHSVLPKPTPKKK